MAFLRRSREAWAESRFRMRRRSLRDSGSLPEGRVLRVALSLVGGVTTAEAANDDDDGDLALEAAVDGMGLGLRPVFLSLFGDLTARLDMVELDVASMGCGPLQHGPALLENGTADDPLFSAASSALSSASTMTS
eukprot:CAMPEP_0196202366 /NCGR_PEP_ID=MMETSP0912-20130531/5173_1 /TAXON_ID=49265 /ORGANISM="Thalassiosira rotula, Strain GSO102" /LENGTH=134 /DNA_ID=CAMNT_0041476253 /DNA_START=213 /DNA_END=617 /DNA_ORIENTATION=+